MTFNAEKHLIELQGKAYLEVKWRLVWFRQECPNGTIDTEEVIVDLDRAVEAEIPTGNWIPNPNRPGKKMPEKMIRRDNGYARYRAIVTDGKGGRASATKSENAASFPDFIEKAETGAVGRALAMLGYGTQFTGDELSEEHRIVDAPVDREQAQGNGHTATKPTPEQEKPAQEHSESFNMLVARARTRAYKLGIKGDQWIAYVGHVTGKQAEQALDIADVGKINANLTVKEQPAREKQPA